MPELPEVETVCRTLRNKVLNLTIDFVEVYEPKCIKDCDLKTFKNSLKNQTIKKIERYGKNIVFILNDFALVSHLRMEGKYFFEDSEGLIDLKHVLVTMFFTNKKELLYHDTRRFGTFHLRPIKEYLTSKPLSKIGLEPFDKQVTGQYLYDKWHTKNKRIKVILLEQDVIAGIGNIYADEILFKSKINPETPSKNLSLQDFENIVKSAHFILLKAIAAGGTTVSSFESSKGVHGKFQQNLNVYQRDGKPCLICKKIIKRIKVGGRGTHFCEKCQPIKLK